MRPPRQLAESPCRRPWRCAPVARGLPAGVLVAVACAGASGAVSSEPVDLAHLARPGVRAVAEWEPALGALVAWPLEIPGELVRALASDAHLWSFVNQEAMVDARAGFAALGLPPERVTLIPAPIEDFWTRDYGPQQVFDERGCMVVVDPTYVNTPAFEREPGTIDRGTALDYFRESFAGDDRAPEAFARHFGLPRWETRALVTGGNFLVDGFGAAFATRALVDENLVERSREELAAILAGLWGVRRLHALPNTEEWGIQHIDCWLKLVDEETLLVKRAPPAHPEAAPVEANVERLRALATPWGRPYRILRIDTPEYAPGMLPAYTNSLILNRSVYVPLFGGPGDEAALASWRDALPGYRVTGFRHPGWKPWDALHCRVRGVFDPAMLRLAHRRLGDGQPAGSPLAVEAVVDPRSGAAIEAQETAVWWRPAGDSAWRRAPLTPRQGAASVHEATIPAQPPGASVEYYLAAGDRSGRRESLPRSAPAGWYRFSVETSPQPAGRSR